MSEWQVDSMLLALHNIAKGVGMLSWMLYWFMVGKIIKTVLGGPPK